MVHPPNRRALALVAALVALALLAFAGNSLLARLALKGGAIDAASFTSLRLLSGALTLGGLAWLQHAAASPGLRCKALPGNAWSAVALFAYAALFSIAYVQLSAATGALLLFGAVQASMMAWGIYQGERMRRLQWAGFALALAGLTVLMLPGLAAPRLGDAAAMLGAGAAWGAYSLLGRGASAGSASAVATTAGNFIRATPMALVVSAFMLPHIRVSAQGALYAVASGALTSGLGYAIWYRVLPQLRATHAAALQLIVPVLAALGGVVLLGESASWATALCGCAIMGGIAMVIWNKPGQ